MRSNGGKNRREAPAARRRTRTATILSASALLERRIRTRLEKHLIRLGFERELDGSLRPPSSSKDSIRSLHLLQRVERLRENQSWLRAHTAGVLTSFADGSEVRPEAIRPVLHLVEADTPDSILFRWASLTWSVPVSQGYGRRLRFLVWDESNGKLIGLIALGDPPFNLSARDSLIGWSSADREDRLVYVMDAFILGAVPPYNRLLGGKLVATLIRTKEVAEQFRRRYTKARGLISGKSKHAYLAAVTTASALGRSSVYNRLVLDGQRYLTPIGFTGGWGHFHIPGDLFDDMRQYLSIRRHGYVNGYEFGDGPNWRLRSIRATLDLIGFDFDLLRHGIKRELFVCWLADNALNLLRGTAKRPNYQSLLSVGEVARLAVNRWMIPRAARDPSYVDWRAADLVDYVNWRAILTEQAISTRSQSQASERS